MLERLVDFLLQNFSRNHAIDNLFVQVAYIIKMRRFQSIITKHAIVSVNKQSSNTLFNQCSKFYSVPLNVTDAKAAQYKQYGAVSEVLKYVFFKIHFLIKIIDSNSDYYCCFI